MEKSIIMAVNEKDKLSEMGDKPTISIMEYFCLNCYTYRDVWVSGPYGQSVHTLECKVCQQVIARGKIPEDIFKEINK